MRGGKGAPSSSGAIMSASRFQTPAYEQQMKRWFEASYLALTSICRSAQKSSLLRRSSNAFKRSGVLKTGCINPNCRCSPHLMLQRLSVRCFCDANPLMANFDACVSIELEKPTSALRKLALGYDAVSQCKFADSGGRPIEAPHTYLFVMHSLGSHICMHTGGSSLLRAEMSKTLNPWIKKKHDHSRLRLDRDTDHYDNQGKLALSCALAIRCHLVSNKCCLPSQVCRLECCHDCQEACKWN